MLEYALRVERSVLPFDVPTSTIDVSPASSKQLNQPSSQAVPPTKLATIQSQAGATAQKEDAYSHKEGSSGSSPRSEGEWPVSILIFYVSPNVYHHNQTPPYPQSPGCLLVQYKMALMLLAHHRNLQRGLCPGPPVTVRLLAQQLHSESHRQDVTQRVEREVEIILSSALLFELLSYWRS